VLKKSKNRRVFFSRYLAANDALSMQATPFRTQTRPFVLPPPPPPLHHFFHQTAVPTRSIDIQLFLWRNHTNMRERTSPGSPCICICHGYVHILRCSKIDVLELRLRGLSPTGRRGRPLGRSVSIGRLRSVARGARTREPSGVAGSRFRRLLPHVMTQRA